MAARYFLALAQRACARREIIVPDFGRRRHRGIGEAQKVRGELVTAVDAERIGLLREGDDVLLASLKPPDHNARQAVVAFEAYEPVPKDHERQNVNAAAVGNEIAPIRPAGRRERRPGDFEVFGALCVRADHQRRSAVEGGMVFDFVLNTGFARGNECRFRRGRGEVKEPNFRGLVIVRRNVAETARCMAAD